MSTLDKAIKACDAKINAKRIWNAGKAKNGKEAFILLDDENHYWMTFDKTGNGGAILSYSLTDAMNTAKKMITLENLEFKYGKKEAYERWMKGEKA